LTPTLDNLLISWRGPASENIQQAPFVTPPLLANKRFLLYFLVESKILPEDVQLSALNSETGLSIKYIIKVADAVFLPASPKPGIIHKMAARAMIRDLEEGGSSLSLSDVDRDEYEVTNRINKEIARLGTKYQIASSQTSFIAVDNLKWFKMPDFLRNANDIPATSQANLVFAQASPMFRAQSGMAHGRKKMARAYKTNTYRNSFVSSNMINMPVHAPKLAVVAPAPTAAPIGVPSFAPSMVPSVAGPTEVGGRKLGSSHGSIDGKTHNNIVISLNENYNYHPGQVLTSTACSLGVFIIPLMITQTAMLLAIFYI